MSKHNHPRVGEQTDVQNPDGPIVYADFNHGAALLMYESEAFDGVEGGGYKISTSFHSANDYKAVYRNVEEVSEKTAHDILNAVNDGVWGYVE